MFSFGKPSKAKFAAQLRDAIIQAGETGEIIYDAESFRLIRRGGDGQVNLANLYREHCALPRSERKAHLQRLATVFGTRSEELPADFEGAKPHLRPKVWNRWFFVAQELQQRMGGGKELDVPRYPLGTHLYSSLVYDTEHAMRSISTEQLEEVVGVVL